MEDEDIIQIIITRKKRVRVLHSMRIFTSRTKSLQKVASGAKELTPSKRSHTFQERTSGIEPEHSISLEELKEYSDTAIQYDPTLVCASAGIQTLPPPMIPTCTMDTQRSQSAL
jgi:hypothetical protein